MLIHTGFAGPNHPWMRQGPSEGTAPDDVWIDFEQIP